MGGSEAEGDAHEAQPQRGCWEPYASGSEGRATEAGGSEGRPTQAEQATSGREARGRGN